MLANLGYQIRRNAELLGIRIGDEIFASAGVGLRLAPNPLEVQAGLTFATAAAAPFDGSGGGGSSGEFRVGANVDLPGAWALDVVAGVGMRDGLGTPDWRATAGLRLAIGGAPAGAAADDAPADQEDDLGTVARRD